MLTNIAGVSLLVFVFSMGAMLFLFVVSTVQDLHGNSYKAERTIEWIMVFMAVALLSFFVFVVCAAFLEASA